MDAKPEEKKQVKVLLLSGEEGLREEDCALLSKICRDKGIEFSVVEPPPPREEPVVPKKEETALETEAAKTMKVPRSISLVLNALFQEWRAVIAPEIYKCREAGIEHHSITEVEKAQKEWPRLSFEEKAGVADYIHQEFCNLYPSLVEEYAEYVLESCPAVNRSKITADAMGNLAKVILTLEAGEAESGHKVAKRMRKKYRAYWK